jgi:hypothetical protein
VESEAPTESPQDSTFLSGNSDLFECASERHDSDSEPEFVGWSRVERTLQRLTAPPSEAPAASRQVSTCPSGNSDLYECDSERHDSDSEPEFVGWSRIVYTPQVLAAPPSFSALPTTMSTISQRSLPSTPPHRQKFVSMMDPHVNASVVTSRTPTSTLTTQTRQNGWVAYTVYTGSRKGPFRSW